jgi:hypothetical protein
MSDCQRFLDGGRGRLDLSRRAAVRSRWSRGRARASGLLLAGALAAAGLVPVARYGLESAAAEASGSVGLSGPGAPSASANVPNLVPLPEPRHQPWVSRPVGADLPTAIPQAWPLTIEGRHRVNEGEVLKASSLQLAAGAMCRVEGGRLEVGRLALGPEAVLSVAGGELALVARPGAGMGVLAGSFEIFHDLGSVYVTGDTTISGSSLSLVSDFHFADGVTLTVEGGLSLDGCLLTSDGQFTIAVQPGAEFRLKRCRVENAVIEIEANAVHLSDNVFSASSVAVAAAVDGAEIFHNVFLDGVASSLLVEPGATVVTTAEGWGNVATETATLNNLKLRWQPPTAPGRTLAGDGRLYVQPGDTVAAALDSGAYTATVQAVELLLAYHTGFLTFDALLPVAPWENELFFLSQPIAPLGKIDTAIGFGFAIGSPDGTLDDHVICELAFTAGIQEGLTTAFFRPKDGSDSPFIDTRLTASTGGTPFYLEHPFTANAPVLTIDGTPPTIDPGATASQDRGSGPIDVFQAGVLTGTGTVVATIDVLDELAGLAAGGVGAVLSGPVAVPGILTGTTGVTLGGEEYVRHFFEFPIALTTPNGTYDLVVTATDRSGNSSTATPGTLEVGHLTATIEVATQGLVATPLTRDVTLVATDAGGAVLATTTVPVDFLGGIGTAVWAGLPNGTAFLSAKTAWTLRRRLPCAFDPAHQALVSFTAAATLPGGDLNGNNLVNLADYNILNANWFTAAAEADITGNGQVNLVDYNILNGNWFTVGDPF